MGMIVYPYFTSCPSYNRVTIVSENTTILSNKYKYTIKYIITYIILNTIGSIIWIFSRYSCRACYRLSSII